MRYTNGKIPKLNIIGGIAFHYYITGPQNFHPERVREHESVWWDKEVLLPSFDILTSLSSQIHQQLVIFRLDSLEWIYSCNWASRTYLVSLLAHKYWPLLLSHFQSKEVLEKTQVWHFNACIVEEWSKFFIM